MPPFNRTFRRALSPVLGALSLTVLLAAPAGAAIVSGQVTQGSGSFIKLGLPFTESNPDNTVGNDTFQNDNLYGFDEGQNIVITSPLAVDILANGLGGGAGSGTLAVGTLVASHYVFFDPKNATTQQGKVTFNSDILAVLTSTNNLAASDFLINTGVTYLNPAARGLERGDVVSISGLREVSVNWTASTPGDYVRVLTVYSPPVPEPATWALVVAGLGAVGIGRRRRA